MTQTIIVICGKDCQIQIIRQNDQSVKDDKDASCRKNKRAKLSEEKEMDGVFDLKSKIIHYFNKTLKKAKVEGKGEEKLKIDNNDDTKRSFVLSVYALPVVKNQQKNQKEKKTISRFLLEATEHSSDIWTNSRREWFFLNIFANAGADDDDKDDDDESIYTLDPINYFHDLDASSTESVPTPTVSSHVITNVDNGEGKTSSDIDSTVHLVCYNNPSGDRFFYCYYLVTFSDKSDEFKVESLGKVKCGMNEKDIFAGQNNVKRMVKRKFETYHEMIEFKQGKSERQSPDCPWLFCQKSGTLYHFSSSAVSDKAYKVSHYNHRSTFFPNRTIYTAVDTIIPSQDAFVYPVSELIEEAKEEERKSGKISQVKLTKISFDDKTLEKKEEIVTLRGVDTRSRDFCRKNELISCESGTRFASIWFDTNNYYKPLSPPDVGKSSSSSSSCEPIDRSIKAKIVLVDFSLPPSSACRQQEFDRQKEFDCHVEIRSYKPNEALSMTTICCSF